MLFKAEVINCALVTFRLTQKQVKVNSNKVNLDFALNYGKISKYGHVLAIAVPKIY